MFILKETCGGCPESYNVYLGDKYVGHMRLRHGYFVAVYDGDRTADRTVYSAPTVGDGVFESDERDFYLNEGCKAIKAAIEAEQEAGPEPLLFEYGERESD